MGTAQIYASCGDKKLVIMTSAHNVVKHITGTNGESHFYFLLKFTSLFCLKFNKLQLLLFDFTWSIFSHLYYHKKPENILTN